MIDYFNMQNYKENNRIEAKLSLGGLPKSLWETYSAFANSLGGVLLLGVEEQKDKSLHVVNLPAPEQLIAEFKMLLNNPKKVSVNILSEQDITIEDVNGKRIVVIRVPRAQRYDKPVYIDGDPFTGTYRRNGEGDYRCTKAEVEAMLRDAMVQTPDMAVLEQMSLDVLDNDTLRRYREHVETLHTGRFTGMDDATFLYQAGAAAHGVDGLLHPTAAGLLMFGTEQAILAQYSQYLLEYQEQTANGEQWAQRLVSTSGAWSGNLYDFYIQVQSSLQSGNNKQHLDSSVQLALGEALANCLMHADYYGTRGIVIIKQQDRVVFSNPGTFLIDVKKAKKGGISNPRNVALMKLFHLAGVGRGTGSGMVQIYQAWEQQGWQDPIVQELYAPDRTTIVFPFAGQIEGREAGADERIIEYLTDYVTGTVPEFRALLGVSTLRVNLILRELLEADIIVAEDTGSEKLYKLKA